jgi:hypothetical protein
MFVTRATEILDLHRDAVQRIAVVQIDGCIGQAVLVPSVPRDLPAGPVLQHHANLMAVVRAELFDDRHQKHLVLGNATVTAPGCDVDEIVDLQHGGLLELELKGEPAEAGSPGCLLCDWLEDDVVVVTTADAEDVLHRLLADRLAQQDGLSVLHLRERLERVSAALCFLAVADEDGRLR